MDSTKPGSQDVYQYKYAALLPHELTRLIWLKPRGNEGDHVEIRLSHSTISSQDRYEALSWVWGYDSETEAVTIDEGTTKSVLFVKPTIKKALLALRQEDDERSLWIDSICINQRDPDERSLQVGSMSRIYSQAQSVLIWLDELRSASIVETIASVRTIKDAAKIGSTLNQLLCHPWFGRRWIIQEVVSAREAFLVWYDTHQCCTAKWTDFCRTIRLLHEFHESHLEEKRSPDLSYSVSNDLDVFNSSQTHQLVYLVSFLTDRATFRHPQDVIAMCTRFRCERPHDTVYALLPLIEATLNTGNGFPKAQPRMDIDYRKTPLDVYKDFLRFSIILSNGRIDAILKHWIPEQHTIQNASWLKRKPSTSANSAGYQYSQREVVQRDFLGPAHQPFFRAAGSSTIANMATESTGIFTGISNLKLEGFVLGLVSSTLACTLNGIHHAWARYGGWVDTEKEPPRHFWATLTAGLDGKGRQAPDRYRILCQKGFRRGAHFNLSCVTSDVVYFELMRVFWGGGKSTADIARRWDRFNFSARLPDQQLQIVAILRKMRDTGKLKFSFLDGSEHHLGYGASRFIQELLKSLDVPTMTEASDYRQLVRKTVLGRKLFKSDERSLFGLVPKKAIENDLSVSTRMPPF